MLAAQQLLESIRNASRIGAMNIVVHLGRVFDPRGELRKLEFELQSRFRAGLVASDAYSDALDQAIGHMKNYEPARSSRPFALSGQSETSLSTAASAWESRPLPSRRSSDCRGMKRLLDRADSEFGRGRVRAWLDTGHVGARAALGMISIEEWHAAVGETLARGRISTTRAAFEIIYFQAWANWTFPECCRP